MKRDLPTLILVTCGILAVGQFLRFAIGEALYARDLELRQRGGQ